MPVIEKLTDPIPVKFSQTALNKIRSLAAKDNRAVSYIIRELVNLGLSRSK